MPVLNRRKFQERRRELAKRYRELAESKFNEERNQWEDPSARDESEQIWKEYREVTAKLGNPDGDAAKAGERLQRMHDDDERREPGPFNRDDEPDYLPDDPFERIDTGVRFQLADGREVRGLTHQHRLTDFIEREERQNVSLGRCVRAVLTGGIESLNDHERRALGGGVDSSGGYLLGKTLSTMFIDAARAASVSMRAGALTVPMDNREMTIARLQTDVAGSWREENTNVAISNPGFDRVQLKAKTLALRIPMSIELIEDASNIVQMIEAVVNRSLGQSLDAAILAGAGAEAAPLGIINTTGVNTVESVGTPTNYDDFSGAVGDVFEANYPGDAEQLAWILRPTDAGTLDVLKDSQNQPLQPSPWVQALRRFYTTGLTSGYSIIGDFSQVVVGLRTSGVRIRVIDAGTNDGGDQLADNLQRQLIAYLRADVAVLRPSWMTVLSGITNS